MNLSIIKISPTSAAITPLLELQKIWAKELDFWSAEEVMNSTQSPNNHLYVLTEEVNQSWQGLCLIKDNLQSFDLLFIYCTPELRRQGFATKLLHKALFDLNPNDLDVLLEVRKENTPARQLYEKFGFELIGRRKKYYADGEDALIYRLSVK